jgi:hypothetical protein
MQNDRDFTEVSLLYLMLRVFDLILRVHDFILRVLDLILRVLECIVSISFGVYLYCGCFNLFCKVWVFW